MTREQRWERCRALEGERRKLRSLVVFDRATGDLRAERRDRYALTSVTRAIQEVRKAARRGQAQAGVRAAA